MEKTKELLQRMRRLIVDEHSRGMGYRKISSKYNIHVSTIQSHHSKVEEVWRRYQSNEKRTSSEARRTRRAADYSKSDAEAIYNASRTSKGFASS